MSALHNGRVMTTDAPARAPRRFLSVLLFLLLALACYGVAMWPLPRYFTTTIPLADGADPAAVQPLPTRPGDNLQLFYHFWLGLDAMTGHSPLFSNVYEFNLGDDSARVQPDLYYLPFSLVFALLHPLIGPAAAWNAAGLASYLLGLWFLYLLARRFAPGPSRLPAAMAALLAATLPYRFITLACGSPTGFAIALPPLLAYGIDRAVRDHSPLGWALAFLELFCAYASDLHVFYFSALAAPILYVVSLLMASARPRDWFPAALRSVRTVLPVLPLAVLLLAAVVGVTVLAHRHLAGTSLHSGRTLFEMAAYSPPTNGLFNPTVTGMAHHAYLGWPLVMLVLLAPLLALRIRRGRSGGSPLPLLPALLLLLAIVGTVLLGLGINAPPVGLWARAARKVIPKYDMIRQTVKIYCLLPTFVAPFLALAYRFIFAVESNGKPAAQPSRAARLLPRLAQAFVWLFTVLAILGNVAYILPVLIRLPQRSEALAIVAASAATRDAAAPVRALAIPIWPGDSHWSSFYEYDATLSRIRFVNGYSPAAPADYKTDIFRRFESINQGVVSDAQLDALLAMGCRYLLFYPHAFPENVSPWPPAYTLLALRQNPRLELLAPPPDVPSPFLFDTPPTLAFRIRAAGEAAPPADPAAQAVATLAAALPRPAALHFLFATPAPVKTLPLKLRAPVFPQPDIRMEMLLDTPSACEVRPNPSPELSPEELAAIEQVPVARPVPSDTPGWSTTPLAAPSGLRLACAADSAVHPLLHQAYLAAGPAWSPRASDGAYAFPPALLWNVGRPPLDPQTGIPDLDSSAVAFFPATTQPGLVLYGPNLPLPPGTYLPVLRHSPLPADDMATFLLTTFRGPEPLASAPVRAGETETRLPPVTLAAPVRPLRFELHVSPAFADSPVPFTVTDLLLVPQ